MAQQGVAAQKYRNHASRASDSSLASSLATQRWRQFNHMAKAASGLVARDLLRPRWLCELGKFMKIQLPLPSVHHGRRYFCSRSECSGGSDVAISLMRNLYRSC